MSKKYNCKFKHFRNIENGVVNSLGGATVAYRVDENGGVRYAVAWCHPNDNYNKHLGREKAAGRLESRNFSSYIDADNVDEFDLFLEDLTGYVRKFKA